LHQEQFLAREDLGVQVGPVLAEAP
jgi:hypothetical protein